MKMTPLDKPAPPARRMANLALLSLGVALFLAVVGLVLRQRFEFFGGLVLAFGEASLVGGLADWFAVRALFEHPLGIPFPHTAIIPHNRERIVKKISEMVQHEWLPPSLVTAKVEAFDFVGNGILPILDPLQPRLREVVRSVARDVLLALSPADLAAYLARAVAGAIEPAKLAPMLADLVARAYEHGWLEPLLREWMKKLHEWTETDNSREVIRGRLTQAAMRYRELGWFKNVTFAVAEAVGGVDINQGATVLQTELRRFAADQLGEDSQVTQIVRDGLKNIEVRLRTDPTFLSDVQAFILESTASDTARQLLEPLLISLRDQALKDVEGDPSRLLEWIMAQLDGWIHRLASDPAGREQVNAWCRRQVTALVQKHHSVLGALVEEQLNRLTNENLSEVIEARVGEDLNWIRLNGALVGGIVGMLLFLGFQLFEFVVHRVSP
jgi:uncharacterized membrane-anchored protein YjiN (DUF445 family)